MEFYKLILFVFQVYCNVLYCIYCERNLCSVLYSAYFIPGILAKKMLFFAVTLLWSVCHTHAVVLLYRIKYQIHTVKRKHCCVAFKFILVFKVKFLNLHPLFSMIWYLPADGLLPYTQKILSQQMFSYLLFKLFHLW